MTLEELIILGRRLDRADGNACPQRGEATSELLPEKCADGIDGKGVLEGNHTAPAEVRDKRTARKRPTEDIWSPGEM
jgi:hypothetical protein